MGFHVTCDRCGQTESVDIEDVADPTQDEAWRQFNLGSQGGVVTLCVKCTSAFGRWVEHDNTEPTEVQSEDSNVEGDTA